MRREHDNLVSCNEALSRQNKSLIDIVLSFDGKIEQANVCIRELAPYKGMYERELIEIEEMKKYICEVNRANKELQLQVLQRDDRIIILERDYAELDSAYHNLEERYRILREEEERKRHYLELVLNKVSIKMAEYSHECDHHRGENLRLHSHCKLQADSAMRAAEIHGNRLNAQLSQLDLETNFNFGEYVG